MWIYNDQIQYSVEWFQNVSSKNLRVFKKHEVNITFPNMW